MSDDPENPDNPNDKEEIDKEPINVLVVDDDEGMRQVLARLLETIGIPKENIHLAEGTLEATAILMERIILDVHERIHLLISDVRLPEEKDGIEFIRLINSKKNRPYIAAVSGYGPIGPLVEIADVFLEKPITIEKLTETLEKVKKLKKLIEEQRKKEELILAQQAEEEAETESDETPPSELLLKKKPERERIGGLGLLNIMVVDDEAGMLDASKRYLERCGARGENIALEKSAEDALFHLMERDVRGEQERFHIVLIDHNLQGAKSGAELIRLIKEGLEPPPFIAAMSGSLPGSGTEEEEFLKENADIFMEKGPDFWETMPKMLEQAKQHIVEQAHEMVLKQEQFNILIVDDDEESRTALKNSLITGHKIASGSIFEAEDTEAAYNLIQNSPERLHLLVLSGSKAREASEELIDKVSGPENHPCIVTKGASAEELAGALEETRAFLKKQQTEDKEELVQDETGHEDEQVLVIPEGQLIISGKEALSYYEMLPDLPDLTKPDSYPPGTKVALFDVDGTLADSFIMGRFVRHLDRSGIYLQLIKDLPPNQRKVNRQAFKKLLDTIEQIEEGTYSKPYEQMIEEMDKFYMEMLTGLSVRKVCAIGAEWSKEDNRLRQYKFAKPIIDLMKYLGIVPALVTGMPAEAFPGYKDGLGGIEERGHPLELHTKRNEQDELVYGDVIKKEGGLPDAKSSIARAIANNGLDIYCVFGDQNSDLDMMSLAIAKKGIAHGKAFYMMNPHLSESLEHMEHFKKGHGDDYKRRHLVVVDKRWGRFAILEFIAHQLFRMERWFQYQEKQEEATREYRDKLHNLVFHPRNIKQFIPEEEQ